MATENENTAVKMAVGIGNRYTSHLKFTDFTISLKAVLAELIAMTLFVFIGCGTALFFGPGVAISKVNASGVGNDILSSTRVSQVSVTDMLDLQMTTANFGVTVALAFGMGIAVLVYSVAHISGGQLNPAVTFGLFLTGKLGSVQSIANICAQLVGSLLAAGFLYGTIPDPSNSNLASNAVFPPFNTLQAFLAESVMTCVLVFTVLMTATDVKSVAKNVAPLAIGFSVFLGHVVLIPIDGCSINPARSFGPAAVSGSFNNFWVFVAGPFLGAFFAAVLHMILSVWQFDTTSLGKRASKKVNDISNDNNGLDDAALRL